MEHSLSPLPTAPTRPAPLERSGDGGICLPSTVMLESLARVWSGLALARPFQGAILNPCSASLATGGMLTPVEGRRVTGCVWAAGSSPAFPERLSPRVSAQRLCAPLCASVGARSEFPMASAKLAGPAVCVERGAAAAGWPPGLRARAAVAAQRWEVRGAASLPTQS